MPRLEEALALIQSLKIDAENNRITTIIQRPVLISELIQAEAKIETAIAIIKEEF